MSAGDDLLRWSMGRALPLTVLASVMMGLLVAISGTAQWARRFGGGPQAEPGRLPDPPERHVAVMMALLRGFAVALGACWLLVGATAILGGVMVLGGAVGSGHPGKALAGGAA